MSERVVLAGSEITSRKSDPPAQQARERSARFKSALAFLLGAFATVLATGLLLAPVADAGTWPGANGRIAYHYGGSSSGSTIYTINPDGTDDRMLVTHPDGGADPSWSPDGEWVAFVSERNGQEDLYVIRADGTGEKQVTNNAAVQEMTPSWASSNRLIFRARDLSHSDPSDRKIVTVAVGDEPTSVYTTVRGPQNEGDNSLVHPEVSKSGALTFTEHHTPEINRLKTAIWTASGGGMPSMVSTNNQTAISSGWSPDGGKVVYAQTFSPFDLDVFINSPGGGAEVNVTDTPNRTESDPRYSPNGKKIVFQTEHDDIFVIDIASGEETQLPTGWQDARDPDWGIAPGTAPQPDDAACRKAKAALKKAKNKVKKQAKRVKRAKRALKKSSGKKRSATRALRIRLGRKQKAIKVFRNEKKKLKRATKTRKKAQARSRKACAG